MSYVTVWAIHPIRPFAQKVPSGFEWIFVGGIVLQLSGAQLEVVRAVAQHEGSVFVPYFRRKLFGAEYGFGFRHIQAFGVKILRGGLSVTLLIFDVDHDVGKIKLRAAGRKRGVINQVQVQSITYAPYFLSTVVVVSILTQFFHTRTGLVNNVITTLGGTARNFMGETQSFRHLYVWSGVWKSAGYSAVLYLASLSSVDASLHEAAILDGANKVQRVVHVDLPTILPTVVISMILSLGNLMSLGYEKAYLMQNDLNLSVSEILSTYVYQERTSGYSILVFHCAGAVQFPVQSADDLPCELYRPANRRNEPVVSRMDFCGKAVIP